MDEKKRWWRGERRRRWNVSNDENGGEMALFIGAVRPRNGRYGYSNGCYTPLLATPLWSFVWNDVIAYETVTAVTVM